MAKQPVVETVVAEEEIAPVSSWLAPAKKAGAGQTYDKNQWFSPPIGDCVIRVVTDVLEYRAHKLKVDENDANDYGRDVKCCGVQKWNDRTKKFDYTRGSCPMCDFELDQNKNPKATSRYVFGIFSYTHNDYKIYNTTYDSYNQIKVLAGKPRNGDPLNYDLEISKTKLNPKTPAKTIFSVGDHGPLDAAAQVLVDKKRDLNLLKQLASKVDYAAVLKKMKSIRKDWDFSMYDVAETDAETHDAAPAPVAAALVATQHARVAAKPVPAAAPTRTAPAKAATRVAPPPPVASTDGDDEFPDNIEE